MITQRVGPSSDADLWFVKTSNRITINSNQIQIKPLSL